MRIVKQISAMIMARGDSDAACDAFRQAGFEVGTLVGDTFSITAPRQLFEKVFHTSLVERAGSIVTKGHAAADPTALPTKGLTEDLRKRVAVASFSAPLSFGPTNY